MNPLRFPVGQLVSPEQLNEFTASTLPGHLGITITHSDKGYLRAELPVTPQVMAPNGYLHAGSVVTLADTACGLGCVQALPEGASGFTTLELKSSFLGTARSGTISTEARLVHGGRSTQLWDAEVVDQSGHRIALFRCTQMILRD